jgi:hypothetical protein
MLILILALTGVSMALALIIFFYDKAKGGIITYRKLSAKELKKLRRTTTFGLDM